MDKYEYKIRAEEIRTLVSRKKYTEAAEIADTIDWTRVKSVMMLCTASDVYKVNRRYDDAKQLLLMANDRHPGGRMILYSLCDLAIRMGDVVGAIEYFKSFVQVAPDDTGRYILQYKLYEAQGVGLEERIAVLEEMKKKEYREKWLYELAYLYHRVGLATKCVEECDYLILLFGEGKYVMKAMELKLLHQPLTPAQQQKFEAYMMRKQGLNAPGDRKDTPEAASGGEPDIRVKTMDMGQYNTMNLQKELAENMKEVMQDDRTGQNITSLQRYREQLYQEQQRAYGYTDSPEYMQEGYVQQPGYGYDTGQYMDMQPWGEDGQVYTEAPQGYGYDMQSQGYGEESSYGEGYSSGEGSQGYGYEADPAYGQDASYQDMSYRNMTYQDAPYQETAYQDGAQGYGYDAGQPGYTGYDAGQQDYTGYESTAENGYSGGYGEQTDYTGQPFYGNDYGSGQEAYVTDQGACADPQVYEDAPSYENAPYYENMPSYENAQPYDPAYQPQYGYGNGEVYENMPAEEEPVSYGMSNAYERRRRVTGGERMRLREKRQAESAVQEQKPQETADDAAGTGEPSAVIRPVRESLAEPSAAGQGEEVPAEAEGEEPGYENYLAQEYDGQISLVIPEAREEEKQITGQMNIEDIMKEWEKMKQVNEEKHRQQLQERVKEQTGSLFRDFDEKEGVLEKLQKEEQIPVRPRTHLPDSVISADTKIWAAGEVNQVIKRSAAAGGAGQAGRTEPAGKTEPGKQKPGQGVSAGRRPEGAGPVDRRPESGVSAEQKTQPEEAVRSVPQRTEPGEATEDVTEAAVFLARAVESEKRDRRLTPEEAAGETETAGQSVRSSAGGNGAPENATVSQNVSESANHVQGEQMPGGQNTVSSGESVGGHRPAPGGRPEEKQRYAPEGSAASDRDDGSESVEPEYAESEDIKYTGNEMPGRDLAQGGQDQIPPEDENLEEETQQQEEMQTSGRRAAANRMGERRRQSGTGKGLSPEEKRLFSSFVPTRGAMRRLVEALDQLSLAAYTGNLIITGDPGSDTLELAKNIIKDMKARDRNFSGKLAKISGSSLNGGKKDLSSMIGQLAGGALIIEHAGEISQEGMQRLLAALDQERWGIVVILIDTRRNLKNLESENPEMGSFFNARFDIEALDNGTLVAYGCQYAKMQEYTIDELGRLALHKRIEDMQTIDHVVTVKDVRKIVREAIESANKKTPKHFMEVLLSKRYDADDMIILHEGDFMADN